MLSLIVTLFLIIVVPILSSKQWITIFWAAEAAALLWAGLRLRRKQFLPGSYLLLFLAMGKFLIYDYSVVFRFDPIRGAITDSHAYLLPERLFTSGILLLAIGRFSAMSKLHSDKTFSVFGTDDHRLFLGLFAMLAFICLNVETYYFLFTAGYSSFFKSSWAAFAAMSVMWTLFSVILRKNIFVILQPRKQP